METEHRAVKHTVQLRHSDQLEVNASGPAFFKVVVA